ncbi:MAG: hypothetical protein H6733_10240 [Alphaproteobacteria bacterium]|nr:hypothetical protein [Alphaproteobacteria bacterium]
MPDDAIARLEAKLDALASTILSKLGDIERDLTRLSTSRDGDLARVERAEARIDKLEHKVEELQRHVNRAIGWAVGAGILTAGLAQALAGAVTP